MRRLLLILLQIIGAIIAFQLAHEFLLDAGGPSSGYYEPVLTGATKLSNGKYEAPIGNYIFVRYKVVRHKINGDCTINIRRYIEFISGPWGGQTRMIEQITMPFVGANDMYHPWWPRYGLLLSDSLVPPKASSQEISLFVKARYWCGLKYLNIWDYIFPRYLQGGIKPDESARVNLVVKR